MKKILLPVLLLVILIACNSKNYPLQSQQKGKWVSLFNGKNLDGWSMKIAGYPLDSNYGNTFRVQNGILSTRYNQYDSFRNRFGALHFNKSFTNYRLRFEYRFVGNTTPGAPSWGFRDGGLQYHGQDPATIGFNQLFPVCLEYNLLGGDGTKERPTGEICASGMYIAIEGKKNASYCTAPTVKRTFTGDTWVTAEIEVKADTIRHFVHGEQIIMFTEPRFDATHALGKTFIGASDKVTSGYISIQSNSHPMDFRKIEIMEY